MSDVPRSLQSWVSTIQSVALTVDVFQLFNFLQNKYQINSAWAVPESKKIATWTRTLDVGTIFMLRWSLRQHPVCIMCTRIYLPSVTSTVLEQQQYSSSDSAAASCTTFLYGWARYRTCTAWYYVYVLCSSREIYRHACMYVVKQRLTAVDSQSKTLRINSYFTGNL